MKFSKTLLAAAALAASATAGAGVVGSTIGTAPPGSTFLTLSSPTMGMVGTGGMLSGAASATIVGGTVFNADQPFADIPAGSLFGGTFLSVGPGPSNNQPTTLSFAPGSGVSYLSFLWGSPDTYNQLTVNSSDGMSQMFNTGNLSFTVDNGNQAFSQYVQFVSTAGSTINNLVFTTNPAIDAFETANYSVTPVPEPETYALMLAGLGAIGFISRRRKKSA